LNAIFNTGQFNNRLIQFAKLNQNISKKCDYFLLQSILAVKGKDFFMSYNFSRTDNIIELELVGDIDLEITADLKNQLLAEIENGKSLRINGSEVSYIDSSGISVLIIAMQNCNKKDIHFAITGASDELLRVIKMAHLDKLLPIETQKQPANMSQAKKTDEHIDADKDDMDSFMVDDDSIAKELADLSIATDEGAQDETEDLLEEPPKEPFEDSIADTKSDADDDIIQEPIDAPQLQPEYEENNISNSDELDNGLFKPAF